MESLGALLIFLLINFSYFSTSESELVNNYEYNIFSNLPSVNVETFTKLRLKRESIQDKTTYNNDRETVIPSVEAPTLLNTSNPPIVPPSTPKAITTIKPLLDINVKEQHKNDSNADVDIVSEISPTSKKNGGPLKKYITTSIPPTAGTDLDVIDEVDIPDSEAIDVIKNHNFTVNLTEDHHTYYNSTTFQDEELAAEYWSSLKNMTHNNLLSSSHRRAMTVKLSFDFPFYGNLIRNITVATGGFLYTGEYVHSWLAATQYIAPLMANFDTSISNISFVRYADNGTAFTVVWENVQLQDKKQIDSFTFSATLVDTGDIIFTYFKIPIEITKIADDKHPVKVGLSDAYIIDKVVHFARRKTIFEYHRVNFNGNDIKTNTTIYLKALPTCLSFTTCESCGNHNTKFDCYWCPSLGKCSTGTDRKRQDWIMKGCEKKMIKGEENCKEPYVFVPNSTEETATENNKNSNNNYNNYSNNEQTTDASKLKIGPQNVKPILKEEEKGNVGLALGFMIPICLVMSILVWILYAYRNPHTKSGQLLIQYRPAQWSWRRGEARYTAATIHM